MLRFANYRRAPMISCLTVEAQDVDLADVSSSHGMADSDCDLRLAACDPVVLQRDQHEGPAPSRMPLGSTVLAGAAKAIACR